MEIGNTAMKLIRQKELKRHQELFENNPLTGVLRDVDFEGVTAMPKARVELVLKDYKRWK